MQCLPVLSAYLLVSYILTRESACDKVWFHNDKSAWSNMASINRS